MGYETTISPNHPVLTDRGWIAAGKLKLTDNVAYSTRREWEVGVELDSEDMPTMIEEIASTFGKTGGVTTVEVETTSPDFHSDGEGSKVAVIRTNRLLVNGRDTMVHKNIFYQLFRRIQNSLLLYSQRTFDEFFRLYCTTFSRYVSGSNLGSSLSLGHMGPFYRFGLALCSKGDIHPLEELDQDLPSDAELFKEAVDGGAGPIQFGKLVDIRRDRNFSGHVYNLDSGGYYIANGLVVKNCRCAIVLEIEKPQATTGPGIPVSPTPSPFLPIVPVLPDDDMGRLTLALISPIEGV
jgi:hypothetical protein